MWVPIETYTTSHVFRTVPWINTILDFSAWQSFCSREIGLLLLVANATINNEWGQNA